MDFFLGTNEPCWLGRSSVPLFVSLTRRDRFRKRPKHHAPGWALDSGGFTQVTERGGWTMSAEEYLTLVYYLDERHGGMQWAAPQDWMCEPIALEATGLTVEEHQHRTVDNFCELSAMDERGLIVPVLQGYAPGEHETCFLMYEQAGVDLHRYRVGVGTVCRRQGTREIRDVISSLRDLGLRLHGFGVKAPGLKLYGDLLHSADSMAWSFRARKAANHGEGALGDGCTHRACTSCYVWAHQWRDRVLGSLP
jgi:hypothetical protein